LSWLHSRRHLRKNSEDFILLDLQKNKVKEEKKRKKIEDKE
jgi:hypothetical protein